MALTSAYLTQSKNVEAILEAIRTAQAPEKFTSRFLLELGFASTNDRFIIGVMKGLGFLDEGGVPSERYYAFLDDTQSDRVLAEAIQEAYGDLFRVNSKANEMDQTQVKQKLKTLTRGAKSDSVVTKMAMTFVTLCRLANFKAVGAPPKERAKEEGPPKEKPAPPAKVKPHRDEHKSANRPFDLSYAIHIELPATRDPAVYDAIFRALKEHIL